MSSTSARAPQSHTSAASDDDLEVVIAVAVLVALGPLAVGAAWALSHVQSLWGRLALAAGGIAGAGGLYLTRARFKTALLATIHAVHRHHAFKHPGEALAISAAHLWKIYLLGLLAAPLLGLLLSLKRPDSDSRFDRAAKGDKVRETRHEGRLARKALAATKTPSDRRGLFLGYRLSGDDFLPSRRRNVFLPWELARKPMLVLGATGSGKTETLLRLAYSTALATDTAVIYLDGKGDRENKHRFEFLMRDAGRAVRSFPDEPFDGWRGDAHEQTNRLLELIDFAREGGGTYYRDIAVKLVRLACQAPTVPPRDSRELLERLNGKVLAAAYGTADPHRRATRLAEIDSLQPRQIDETRARYEAFFGTVEGALDGKLHFDQLDTGYFLLDGLRLKYETGYLARFLVEDFTQWAVAAKARHRRVLLIVDEFSAIAEAASSLVDVVERTRGFGVATILAPQVAEGMGGTEATARIIGSAASVLVHATAMPEELVRIAGSRRVYSTSHQLDQSALTGLGSARLEHEYRVDPNDVRGLRVGQAYLIATGRATKLQIVPSPQTSEPLELAPRALTHPHTPTAKDGDPT